MIEAAVVVVGILAALAWTAGVLLARYWPVTPWE
jgi:hypothetical protein